MKRCDERQRKASSVPGEESPPGEDMVIIPGEGLVK